MTSNRTTRSSLVLSLACLASVSVARGQISDYPGATDFKIVQRPANSFIIGAMHIDNDEYQVPLGPVEPHADHLGKSITITGPIDTLAYAGPTTASSLTTYTGVAAQLIAAGYTAVWSCARTTCGGAFYLANILDKPVLDSIHKGDFGFWINDDLNATNDDIRFGTFRRGAEYMLVMGSLAPGRRSGALLIRVNGPRDQPVLLAAAAPLPPNDPLAAPVSPSSAPAPTPALPRFSRLRAAASAALKQVPQE